MPETGMDPMTLAMLSGQPDALETMRKYALAQQLQGMALGGPQQPQQLGLEGKYPHAARIGPISAVAPLIEALMARQGFKTAGPPMMNLMGGGPPPQQSAPLTPAPPAADPNAQNVQPLVQRAPGQSLGQTMAGAQPQAKPWYSVPGLADNAARMLFITNRADWAKAKMGPESWQQLVRGFGDEGQAAAAVQAKAHADAFKDLRPGSTGMDFLSGESTIAADPARGEQYQQTPGGVVASGIPGSDQIQADRAAALKKAQEGVTPHYAENPFKPGQPNIIYPQGPGNAPNTPPARPYFPPRTGNTAADLTQQQKGAESGQAYSDKLNTLAESATEVRRSLAELRNLSNTGGVSVSNPAKQELGSYLIAAGMSPETVGNMLHTDVGALVAASKQTGSLAVDSIHQMTSRGSNFDLATFMRYNPNLDMGSPAGFQRVVDFMDKRMQQEVAKQADFEQWSQTQPPNRWATGHTARWLQQQNEQINAGKTNSRPPLQSFEKP